VEVAKNLRHQFS